MRRGSADSSAIAYAEAGGHTLHDVDIRRWGPPGRMEPIMKDSAGSMAGPVEHKPYVPASADMPEMGFAPIVVGAILGILFGMTSLYLVLQVGMTVSASVPIAVLSITLFRAFTPIFGRNATILENNMVQ